VIGSARPRWAVVVVSSLLGSLQGKRQNRPLIPVFDFGRRAVGRALIRRHRLAFGGIGRQVAVEIGRYVPGPALVSNRVQHPLLGVD
jgi:hypothetical protein